MICGECAWEADLRSQLAGVDFETYARRPSMAGRGHQACRGGTQCVCQHDGTPHAVDAKPAAPATGKRARRCPECKKTVALYPNGTLWWHRSGGKHTLRCPGWGRLPK